MLLGVKQSQNKQKIQPYEMNKKISKKVKTTQKENRAQNNNHEYSGMQQKIHQNDENPEKNEQAAPTRICTHQKVANMRNLSKKNN